ncbi:MAG TPA: DUF222 domain-containing protein [Acidimicrobiales bacterium]
MAQMTTPSASALVAGGVAGAVNQDVGAELTDAIRIRAMADGRIIVAIEKAAREETFREDGATSTEAWLVQRFGFSPATARVYTEAATKAFDTPHLVRALCQGEITFDKLRAVVGVASPQTDQELCDQARRCTVRELADIARVTAERRAAASAAPGHSSSRSEHDSRYVRFNDERRTMSVQLPKEAYAQTKACVDAFADAVPSEEKTPLDQRRCAGFMGIVDSVTPARGSRAGTSRSNQEPSVPNPFLVVAHVPLEALVDEGGDKSELAAELEHDGLIDVETVQRIACDATVVVAVDDEAGHTMYEGRARRFPSGAQRREVIRRDRQCRFPGCSNATFAAVHHVVPWKLGGGTDLDNLVLVCRHHHGVVHRNGWSMTGNPNEELRIENPKGRVTVSRPSALWTRVTARAGAAARDRAP